jgi:hypothetical protein
MLPKDKANELVNTMLDKLYDNGSLSFKRILHARAVECAKVLADEMLHQYTTLNAEYRSEKVVFWQTVRTELDYVQS